MILAVVTVLEFFTWAKILESGAVGSDQSAPSASGDKQPSPALAAKRDPATDSEQKRLEKEKLKLEIKKLKNETSWRSPSQLSSGALGFLGGIITAGLAWWGSRRTRLGTYDHAVLSKRLAKYDDLVNAMEPLTLNFPKIPISKSTCRAIGECLSACYYSGTGILLSEEARRWYSIFVNALTRAAAGAPDIKAPSLDQYSKFVSENNVDKYRKELSIDNDKSFENIRDRVQMWDFDNHVAPTVGWFSGALHRLRQRFFKEDERKLSEQAQEFGDFVLLQTLASRFRTALTQDLRGRRRPG
jgi:hypothetical protein